MLAGRCLVVDDSPTIRLTLKAMLERLGVPAARVDVAATGEDAMRLFEAQGPDLVFLDVEMPDVEGHEVCRRMLEQRPLARIVAVTGLDRTDPRVRDLVTRGAFDVVHKPLRLDRMQALLDEVRRESMSGVERIR